MFKKTKKHKISNSLFLVAESSSLFFVAALLLRFALEGAYVGFVNPLFEYSGFVIDFNFWKYVESWIVYIVLVSLFPKVLKKPSDYLMAYFLFSFLTPLLIYYGLSNQSREHLYVMLLGVLLILVFRMGRPIKVPTIRNGMYFSYWLLGFGALSATAWMIGVGGTNYFNLDLTKVYDFRRDVGELINQGVMAYVNNWAAKVFGPIILAIALLRRNYLIAALAFILHVLWFGISAHKSVLFSPFLVTFAWVWFRSTRALSFIPIAMTTSVIAAFSMFKFLELDFVGSMFIRRVFFVPSYLTFVYYDFFSKNPFVFWSQSITSWFVKYPYARNSADMIGVYIDTEAHANNSFLSTGFMHAGLLGVVLYGVLIGLLFRLVDSISYKAMPQWFAAAVLIVPTASLLTSADLPTALLTHGVGLSIFFLFLLRSQSNCVSSKRSDFNSL